ncbi:DNA (cytosine-5-)-methyltransferase [Castilleja foliolosa]|uniref:DNA (Cytosine-5-)-methyltransferase n=1 Tax=Castilleja foliolosa TaxID=1961234 RepID=A0ABD3ER77_9LAMI
MDFIFAARMAKKYEKDGSNISRETINEAIFGIMEKMLQLFEIGFTVNKISATFEICGSEASPQELAYSVFDLGAIRSNPAPKRKIHHFDSLYIRIEEYINISSQVGAVDSLERSRVKIPKAQHYIQPHHLQKLNYEFAEEPVMSVGRGPPEALKWNSSSVGGRTTA